MVMLSGQHRFLRRSPFALLGIVLLLILTACGGGTPAPAETPAPESTTVPSAPTAAGQVATTPAGSTTDAPRPATIAVGAADQPVLITGTFDYTNDIITEYYVEHMVALVDMYGFVIRDQEWELPVDSQVLGYLDIDEDIRRGSYRLQLPALPAGTLADVDNNGQSDQGVQVFAISYSPNLTGDPFAAKDDRSEGWPSYLASVKADTENQDEIIGGALVIWSPDANQQFPTGFGEDELLFTADDPVGPVPAGYSIIDLEQTPFGIRREAEQELTLYEPDDIVVKDYSSLSYTEAFNQMFEQVRREYAFNGIPEKQPDWDALYDELFPRVEQAERRNDGEAFFLALRDFTYAFRDGHVNLDGGSYSGQYFAEQAGAGFGLALRELDDGRVIVVYSVDGGPADEAGIEVGAQVTAFDGKPIDQAIADVQPLTGPYSTDFALRYNQVRDLTRAPARAQVSVTYENPGEQARTVTLTAVPERESYFATSPFQNYDPLALPVEHRILDSGVGYVRVNSNYDDLNLIIRLFERALQVFEEAAVPGIIIDMRLNFGGASLGLAGFLTDQEIPLSQLEYFSEKTGEFEPEGPPRSVEPNESQYRFDQIVLLVDQTCFSACEIEAYGFSQIPDVEVLGQYPTAGVEAEVARGQFQMPEGMTVQVPTGRFINPDDGSIFLEGTGVEPTRRIPIDAETVLSNEDTVLQAAEQAIIQ